MRKAIVSMDGQPVGVLEETGAGTRFTYDATWISNPRAVPVSLTMPLRQDPYESRGLLTFFENLLPEGWLLELATTKLKVAKDDAFGILIATCVDCIGAVEIRPHPETGP